MRLIAPGDYIRAQHAEAFIRTGSTNIEVPDAFFIGVTEVSNQHCSAILHLLPEQTRGIHSLIDNNFPERPLLGVDFHRATTIARAFEARIPKHSEWELAARRSGIPRPNYPQSYRTTLGVHAWSLYTCTHPMPIMASLPDDLGIHDLFGNAYEWCNTDSIDSPVRDFRFPGLRGGSYLAFTLWQLSCDVINDSHRLEYNKNQGLCIDESGLRLALSPITH
jgi:formylglycine-generating enzyme required for sulfatase activity